VSAWSFLQYIAEIATGNSRVSYNVEQSFLQYTTKSTTVHSRISFSIAEFSTVNGKVFYNILYRRVSYIV
jgi:hypothetical protein